MLESVNLIVRLIEKKRSEMLDQSPTFAACSPAHCIPLLLLSELLVVVLYLVIPRVSASSIHGWRVERKKGRKEGSRRMPTILGELILRLHSAPFLGIYRAAEKRKGSRLQA